MLNTLTDLKIKVIGFDADDTLWKNEDLFLNALNEIKDILKLNSNLKINTDNLSINDLCNKIITGRL